MKTKLLIAALAITLSSQTYAQKTTFGGANCGQWIKQLIEPDKSWLLGFLSGINVAAATNNALDKIKSPQQIYLWMDNYCKANPLSTVTDGAYTLMNELIQKK
jgi:hypothetical protein